jgi:hypothetical protein
MNVEAMLRRIYDGIELPAFRRITDLMTAGLIEPSDAALIRTSADSYKRVLLDQYLEYDPEVRELLLDSLFADYRVEVTRLIDRIAQRHRFAHAIAEPAPQVAAPRATPAQTAQTGPNAYARAAAPRVEANSPDDRPSVKASSPVRVDPEDRPSRLSRVGELVGTLFTARGRRQSGTPR